MADTNPAADITNQLEPDVGYAANVDAYHTYTTRISIMIAPMETMST